MSILEVSPNKESTPSFEAHRALKSSALVGNIRALSHPPQSRMMGLIKPYAVEFKDLSGDENRTASSYNIHQVRTMDSNDLGSGDHKDNAGRRRL